MGVAWRAWVEPEGVWAWLVGHRRGLGARGRGLAGLGVVGVAGEWAGPENTGCGCVAVGVVWEHVGVVVVGQ